jgi:AFG3 family protein
LKLANKADGKRDLVPVRSGRILGKRPFDNRTTYDEFVNGPESNQDPVAQNLVHEGVSDHSGTFERNPEETDTTKE